MSEKKKVTTPLERGTKKVSVLMRAFGMRTRVFRGKTRSIIKGTRKIYPQEVSTTIVETARGVGIRVKPERLWFTFLKLIPFSLLLLIAILELSAPSVGEKIAEKIGINVFHVFLGPDPNSLLIVIILPLVAATFLLAELAERFIRIRYIQDRLPRFLSGAEWKVSEPPIVLDVIASSYNIFWLSYIFLVIIYAPLSFSTDIVNKFLEVYKTSFPELFDKTTITAIIDIALISGMFFAYLFLKYEKFRGELDREQIRHDIQLETNFRELFQTMVASAFLAIIELLVFAPSFWSNVNITTLVIFFIATVSAGTLGVWIVWQNENYIYIALIIWLIISDVVLIFLNANNNAYSWMIICHLFLIILIALIYLNGKFGSYLEAKGITEPSWIFNPLPLFAYLAFWKKGVKRIGKRIEKEIEELKEEELVEKVKERKPLVINLDKIKEKGEYAEKIVQIYQKITKHLFKGPLNILTFTAINREILDLLKEDNNMYEKAKEFTTIINRLLWDETFRLDEGKAILEIAESIYEEILKRR